MKNPRKLISLLTALCLLGTNISVALAYPAEAEMTDRQNDVTAEVSVFCNIIKVTGQTSGLSETPLTLSYIVTADEEIIAAEECTTEEDGSYAKRFELSPEVYGESTHAVLRIGGKNINVVKADINLFSKTEIDTLSGGINNIGDVEDWEAFLDTCGAMISAESYKNYPEQTYNIFVDTKPDTFSDMSAIEEYMPTFWDKGNRAVILLDTLNEASSLGQWSTIKTLMHDSTYSDLFSVDVSAEKSIESEKEMYIRMCSLNYSTTDDIVSAYASAVSEQKQKESSNSSGSSSSGGSSGGSSGKKYSSSVVIAASVVEDTTQLTPEEPETPEIEVAPAFDDLSEVKWAHTAINSLREKGIVSGDGSGKFYPMDTVTREEMVTMIMNSVRFTDALSNAQFTDVKESDWYYTPIQKAYSMGLIEGYPDGSFGIGQLCRRADIAVMLARLLDVMDCTAGIIKPAVVFEDYYTIPDYAAEQVSMLQQAGVINGDDKGCFNPNNSATRAEAAVLIYNVLRILEV